WVKLHFLEDGTLTRTDADQRFRVTDTGLDIITATTASAARTTEPPAPSELIAEGRLDEGIAAYRAAKPDVQTLNRLGGTFQRLGRYHEAVALFRLATELYPESSNAWDSLGAALLDSGDVTGAAEATRTALARVDADTITDAQTKFWVRILGKTRLREMGAR
ncbi:MAG TPA: hypothetical protein VEO54_09405, partial [Thermoanaerobaculia bacterium]|nr:hypothetical protein [Thermoanaerobaculia bacterium]